MCPTCYVCVVWKGTKAERAEGVSGRGGREARGDGGAMGRRCALLCHGHGDLGWLELGEGDVHAREAHPLGMAHGGVAVLAVGRRRCAICTGCRRRRRPPRLLAALALAPALGLGLDVDGCLAVRRGSLASSLVLLVCAHVDSPRAVVAAADHLRGRKRGRGEGGRLWSGRCVSVAVAWVRAERRAGRR
jgi:hypothetical protein